MSNVNKNAIAYGVGVGPGDPELITLKAVRIIKQADVIALPSAEPKSSLAYRIALKAVSEIETKPLLGIEMPMVKDKIILEAAHEAAAGQIAQLLDRGKSVAFLTIGDPTIYCTFSYIQHILDKKGYKTELISGVPSFCAAAARLNKPLVEREEMLTIMPGCYAGTSLENIQGTCVLMKSASRMSDIKSALKSNGRQAKCVINCGLDGEMTALSIDEIPDDAGYFSLIVTKQNDTV